MHNFTKSEQHALAENIKQIGLSLGFQQVGIAHTALERDEAWLNQWVENGYHADMDYMHKHGTKRSRPAELEPGTVSVISVRLNYLPEPQSTSIDSLEKPENAFISRYALGRDYHKLLRKRLQKFAKLIEKQYGNFGYRAFVDSAPVLEKALARNAGLGWIGKHTLVINRDAGSYFFLGELYTDLPLPADKEPVENCGSCAKCIDICPTQAIVAPYQLDAGKCISYLTIENKGEIPIDYRKAIGNRIFGCDDCQHVCPWNRFASLTDEADFKPRHGLNTATLINLFGWDEETFLKNTEGSAIRRLSHARWLRNIAVALGNAPTSENIVTALRSRLNYDDDMVVKHVEWALSEHLPSE